MGTHPGRTVSEAFQRGIRDGSNPADPDSTFAPVNMHPLEIRDACAAWRKALSQHEHTSYYGVNYIRRMRAYFLGRLRAARHA